MRKEECKGLESEHHQSILDERIDMVFAVEVPVIRAIRGFVTGFVLPLKGGIFLLQHRRLLLLAVAPLLLTVVLYVAGGVLLFRYYSEWFGLLMDRPATWYLLVGYYVLQFLAFFLVAALAIFSFILVARVVATPFLERLSEQTEAVLRGTGANSPFALRMFVSDLLRASGHTLIILLILIVVFPLSFLPVVGQAVWVGIGWVLLAYDFASFAMDRHRLSLRTKWRLLRANLSEVLGLGAAIFLLMVVPLVGLVVLPTATVAGTMLVLEIEARGAPFSSRV